MSVDSASHDDVAGLFKRLGARAGAPQYHDFSDAPSADTRVPPATPPVIAAAMAAPRVEAAPVPAQAPPVPPVPVVQPGAVATAAAETPLQRLFLRLAAAPLQGSGLSPLARLRQR